MTIFGNRKTLPKRTAMMLLERFVWQGWPPVQQAALALLKLAEPVIMHSDFETIIKGLQEGSIFLGSSSVSDLTEGRTGGFSGRGIEDSFDEFYGTDCDSTVWSHAGDDEDDDCDDDHSGHGYAGTNGAKDTPKKNYANDMLAAILADPDVFASMCDGYAKEGVNQSCLEKLEKEYASKQKSWFGWLG